VRVSVCFYRLNTNSNHHARALTSVHRHSLLIRNRHEVSRVQVRVHPTLIVTGGLPSVEHKVVVQVVGHGRLEGGDGLLVVVVDDLRVASRVGGRKEEREEGEER